MSIGNPQTLKERVDVLEQAMLAIDCLSNLTKVVADDNSTAGLPASDVSFLLSHLSEDALYKVEALRMMIDAMPAAAQHAPRRAAA